MIMGSLACEGIALPQEPEHIEVAFLRPGAAGKRAEDQRSINKRGSLFPELLHRATEAGMLHKETGKRFPLQQRKAETSRFGGKVWPQQPEQRLLPPELLRDHLRREQLLNIGINPFLRGADLPD